MASRLSFIMQPAHDADAKANHKSSLLKYLALPNAGFAMIWTMPEDERQHHQRELGSKRAHGRWRLKASTIHASGSSVDSWGSKIWSYERLSQSVSGTVLVLCQLVWTAPRLQSNARSMSSRGELAEQIFRRELDVGIMLHHL
jgi:hypothetical protein